MQPHDVRQFARNLRAAAGERNPAEAVNGLCWRTTKHIGKPPLSALLATRPELHDVCARLAQSVKAGNGPTTSSAALELATALQGGLS